MRLDHLAVACGVLQDGTDWVEDRLGVPVQSGGQHPHFGTHNTLLSLGPREYLEVISVDPDATPLAYPRWFDLDRFSGAPRLTNWIVQTDAITDLPRDLGPLIALTRGDLNWRMAVPDTGALPFDNLHPAMICWDGPHPAPRLKDHGIRLLTLTVQHPQAVALQTRLSFSDPRLSYVQGPPALTATFATPDGVRVL